VQNEEILRIKDLSMGFENRNGVTPILDRVNLSVHKNEIVAIVGESGCGKSVTAMSIMRLLKTPPAKYLEGEILFHGEDLLKASERRLRSIRGDRISMIFQEPLTSLNPVLTIEDQIGEVFRLHSNMNKNQIREATIELLNKVRIPAPEARLRNYPGQFSGGMRQRIMIAMAIACNPELLIADEPTTALDVTIQAQILKLIKQINQDSDMACILITHDLGVVAEFAQRVVVMYAGQPIEETWTTQLFTNPRHPYTRGLLASLPKMNDSADRLSTISGSVPSPKNMPKGCRFNTRCPYAQDLCKEEEPLMRTLSEGHICKCHFAEIITEDEGKWK
jgi:oligopeptide/dipeptide ABC transporter ATP-binding protein